MQHTCKACGTRVKIPEEWILIGLDERIKCQVCGKRVNLKISEYIKKKNGAAKTEGGTVIVRQNKSIADAYKLIISNLHTTKTLAIVHLNIQKIYIIGRSIKKIHQEKPSAEAIIIPTEFDPAVSRIHFELQAKQGKESIKFSIKDLNSLHKTHLLRNDMSQVLDAHEQVLITVNDKIRIGQNTLISLLNA